MLQDHISFATVHGKQPGQEVTVDDITYQVFATHCVQHSPGAHFPEQLELHTFDRIIQKGTDQDDECFSAFASFGKHRDTGLASYLQQHDIQQLYVAGVTLEQCVKCTVQDAVKAGFATYVIADACAPVDAGAEEQTLQDMHALGARIVVSANIPKAS